MAETDYDKFDVLGRLALDAAAGADLEQAAEAALKLAAQSVDLTAASLFLWDEKGEITLSVDHAASESSGEQLKTLELELFITLRARKKLTTAYLSFDTDPPCHSFTQPLRYRGKIFGAVIGLQEGLPRLVSESKFIEILAALFTLSFAVDKLAGSGSATQEMLSKERAAAIVDVAVTVNHEINNPLTAILGNVQLLLLKHDGMDEDLKEKLKVVEDSALRIRDVTQKLLRLTSPRSVNYSGDTNMIDISDDETGDA